MVLRRGCASGNVPGAARRVVALAVADVAVAPASARRPQATEAAEARSVRDPVGSRERITRVTRVGDKGDSPLGSRQPYRAF
jgi:hypothetical protein